MKKGILVIHLEVLERTLFLILMKNILTIQNQKMHVKYHIISIIVEKRHFSHGKQKIAII
jgi:hypothetical protein